MADNMEVDEDYGNEEATAQILDELQDKLWGTMGRYRAKRVPAPVAGRRRVNNSNVRITADEVVKLCDEAIKVLQDEPLLIHVQAPVTVCGDVHGQFDDLKKLFHKFGRPHHRQYLFLGDYVDRGDNSLETICMLLTLKVAHPGQIHLIRGNHEIRACNLHFGFWDELIRRFRGSHGTVFNKFNEVFTYLPLAAVIENQVFCVHGGLSPNLRTLDQFDELQKPLKLIRGTWPHEILWSDPRERAQGWEPNLTRCTSYIFGRREVEQFLRRNGLTKIARGHEHCKRGFQKLFNFKLVTVFSAPNYCGRKNQAAVMKVTKEEDNEDGEEGELKFALARFGVKP